MVEVPNSNTASAAYANSNTASAAYTNSISAVQAGTTVAGTQETKPNADAQGTEQTPDTAQKTSDSLEKLIQSRVDRSMADFGKKLAMLQKENEKLKKANLSAEELKELKQAELSEREATLAQKEKDLLDKEHRLYAIRAIKEIGLDDGSENSLALVDFVMGEDEAAIDEKVKAFHKLVNQFVSARVDEKFKAIGRIPNGGAPAADADERDNSVAEMLGKRQAEKARKSNEVLQQYIGGKK